MNHADCWLLFSLSIHRLFGLNATIHEIVKKNVLWPLPEKFYFQVGVNLYNEQ